MVSHDFKCIFLHVPKVAGESVEHFFLNKLGLEWESRSPLLLRKNDVPAVGPERLAHLLPGDFVKYKYLSQELFDNYFKFSFVRNPWSRAVSMYKYMGYSKIISFETFANKQLPVLMETEKWFVRPQADFVYSEDGEMLVDFVGRFEQLQKGFDEVCMRLKIEDTKLPHVNKSKHQTTLYRHIRRVGRLLIDYPELAFSLRPDNLFRPDNIRASDFRGYYTSKSRESIARIYAKDIEAFDYVFEPVGSTAELHAA